MLPHDGGNRSELKTMHMFCLICQVAAPIRRQTMLFCQDCPVKEMGAKSVISGLFLFK